MPSKKSLKIGNSLQRRVLAIPTRRMDCITPLFLTKSVRRSIERLLPVGHYQRLRKYFDMYGCLRCSHNNVLYGANGFCSNCIGALGKRMRKVDKALEEARSLASPAPKLGEVYLRPYNSARQILRDLVPRINKKAGWREPEPKSPRKVYLKF
jgi:hypothetical protein